MEKEPVYKRDFAAFISYAHVDKAVVDPIYHWLSKVAGLPIWFDEKNLPGGAMIASDLPKGIRSSRAIILMISDKAIRSRWVENEYNNAAVERSEHPDFNIIAIKLDDTEMPGFLKSTKYIELNDGNLDLASARLLLLSLYNSNGNQEVDKVRDVYLAAGWRENEKKLNFKICEAFIKKGFRIIGDSREQNVFDPKYRVNQIIKSCGSVLAILPNREEGITSKYILQEIEIAQNMGLFTLVLYEQGVKLKESIAMAQDANKISDGFKLEKSPTLILRQYDLEEKESDLKDVVYDMEEEWDNPAYPHYVFVARGLSKDQDEIFYFVKEIVELVTAVPCIFGDQITETNIHEAIRIRIRNAAMVIADISEDNMNSCIEAGIALGANVKLNLIAKAPRKRPGPFMLRDQQVWHYEDDVELLGIAHNLVQQFKRRVINAELPQNEYWG